MSLKFIGDKVFTSIIIKNERKLISGNTIDELFKKVMEEICQ
ncbi:MAG: hypothetical protein ACRC1R_00700 [Cetobacterium sp.]